MSSRAAAALVFCTSAAVLVLEILAGRLVAPYVGVSLETYTGIIGTVLAGIALGSAVGGRLADSGDPRRLLGPLLVGGGALALLSLPIVSVVGPGLVAGGAGAVLFLAAAAFFLPSVVLSAVSPMVAKLRLESLGETGTVVGGLSAAGTAGALVGTFVTGFVLVAALPSRPIVIGVGTALVVAGLVLWWRLRGAPPGRPVLLGVLVTSGLGVAFPSPCEVETGYFCVRIDEDEDRPAGRALFLDTLRHSYVDLDDPTYLEFRYARLFADVVEAEIPTGPVGALHVGGGGFSLPRWLAATRPGSDSLVLEIDDELVGIAEERLGLVQGPELRVQVGDARSSLVGEDDDAYDLVVGDAFGGLSVPWHLTTVEFLEEVDRVVADDGVYVLNLIDGGPDRFLRAELATMQRVFDHVMAIAPTDDRLRPANWVLVASDRPLRLGQGDVDADDGRVLGEQDVDDLVDGARALTDDFAPVEQLLTRR